MVRVHIETEVDLDVELMAKTFAHMHSDEQAKFFAMAYQEMAGYTKEQPDGTDKEMGEWGRDMQMSYITDEFEKEPDARAFIEELYESAQPPCNPKTELEIAQDAIRASLDSGNLTFNGATIGPGCDYETLELAEAAMANYATIAEADAAMAERVTEQDYLDSLPVAMEVLRTFTGSDHRTTAVCRPGRDAPVYVPGDRVHIDVAEDSVFTGIGRCTHVNNDGTIEVLLEPKSISRQPLLDKIRKRHADIMNDALVDEGILDAIRRDSQTIQEAFGLPYVASNDDKVPNADTTCEECGGTGEWTNPAGGRDAKSPCSKGCPKL
jgi:hypothetical protein